MPNKLLHQELQRIVPGRVRSSTRMQKDFSNLPGPYPSAVLHNLSDDELRKVLDFAAQRGVQISLRGASHSCNGQTQTDQILLDLRSKPLPNDLVTPAALDAGLQWGQIERRLRAQQQAVPVLADHYGLSVGGTLSVGCYGADSLRHGALVHQVKALEVMTADGNLVKCSGDQNASLFEGTLAGVGGPGIIRRVDLKTTRNAPFTYLQSYRANSLEELAVHAMEAQTTTADIFKALWANGRYVATYGRNFDHPGQARDQQAILNKRAFLSWLTPRYRTWRSFAVKLWVGRYANAAKIWSDYLLPESDLLTFCQTLQVALNDPIARAVKAIYLLPIKRHPQSNIYLEGSNSMAGGQVFGMGLYCMLPRSDLLAQAELRAWLEARLHEALSCGGTPYLYGHHRLDTATMAQAFGPNWQAYRDAQAQWNGQQLLRHVLPT